MRIHINPLLLSCRPAALKSPGFFIPAHQFILFFFSPTSGPRFPIMPCGLPHGVEKRLRPERNGQISNPDCGYPHSTHIAVPYPERSYQQSNFLIQERTTSSTLNSLFFLSSSVNYPYFYSSREGVGVVQPKMYELMYDPTSFSRDYRAENIHYMVSKHAILGQ